MEGLGEEVLEHMLAVPSSSYTNNIGLDLEPAQDFFRSIRHQHQHEHGTCDRNVVDEGNDQHHHYHQLHTMSSSSASTSAGITNIRDSMQMRGMLYSTPLGQLHTRPAHAHALSVPTTVPSQLLLPHQHHQALHSQPAPGIRPPRVRARRGQATDPHSIAERLRRERIAERMKALQELVPTANKTDRAAMLDEIVDYVKFLRLQVKVLSMSTLGGAGAIAQLVADVPLSALEVKDIEGGTNQQVCSNDGTEQQVAKLLEQDVGAAMQFLQSKALCIMPISLASAILCTPQSEAASSLNQTAIHRA